MLYLKLFILRENYQLSCFYLNCLQLSAGVKRRSLDSYVFHHYASPQASRFLSRVDILSFVVAANICARRGGSTEKCDLCDVNCLLTFVNSHELMCELCEGRCSVGECQHVATYTLHLVPSPKSRTKSLGRK